VVATRSVVAKDEPPKPGDPDHSLRFLPQSALPKELINLGLDQPTVESGRTAFRKLAPLSQPSTGVFLQEAPGPPKGESDGPGRIAAAVPPVEDAGFTAMPAGRSSCWSCCSICWSWRSMKPRAAQVSARGGLGWNLSGLFGLPGRVAGSLRFSLPAACISNWCVGGQGLLVLGRELLRHPDRQMAPPGEGRTASTRPRITKAAQRCACLDSGWSRREPNSIITVHQGHGAWLISRSSTT